MQQADAAVSAAGMFATFRPLIQAADGLTLRQVCSLTGLEGGTIQNWIKRGFVPHPVQKKYRERQLARILLIDALRGCMQIDAIGSLLTFINGDTDDESDDIVSEDKLYDYLCAVVRIGSAEVLPFGTIPNAVCAVLADYEPVNDTAAKRLEEALTVMAYAYTAGRYKQEADDRLQTMQKQYGF